MPVLANVALVIIAGSAIAWLAAALAFLLLHLSNPIFACLILYLLVVFGLRNRPMTQLHSAWAFLLSYPITLLITSGGQLRGGGTLVDRLFRFDGSFGATNRSLICSAALFMIVAIVVYCLEDWKMVARRSDSGG